jgi:hypothetical protein
MLTSFAYFDDNGTDPGRYQPFDGAAHLTIDGAESDEYFAAFYYSQTVAWRRLDGEGLSGLARLALKLDSDTNNTSLALAFELPDGRVLLFPGDAQVGNWQSWHDYSWTSGSRQIKANDLLARTVLYKVGIGGLVALLPVDEYIAHKKKHWGRMPFVPLLSRLREKTSNRILRADGIREHGDDEEFEARIHFAESEIEPEGPGGKPTKRPLYVDYTMTWTNELSRVGRASRRS